MVMNAVSIPDKFLFHFNVKNRSGGIAQLVERLPLTLKVPGSNPSRNGSTKKKKREAGSRVITPPTSPLSRVGRYKVGSGWYM